MPKSPEKKSVVILGAGYAGLTAAKRLDKRTDTNMELTLIDASSQVELIQHAHLIAGGIKEENEARFPISNAIANTSIKFIRSYVHAVKAKEKQVGLQSKHISFDILIVALGAKTQSFGIEGIEKSAFTLHSIDDALKIKANIKKLVNESINISSSNSGKKFNDTKHIVVVGGGPTGVGTASTIAELLGTLGKKDKIKVKVVSASETILPGMDKTMINEAMTILKEKDIEIITDSLVSDVHTDKVVLKDGKYIVSSMTIWTPGVKGYDLHFEPEVSKTRDGRIVVNEFCQINEYPEIYCIGDIGAIKDISGTIKDETLGQTAISEAIYLTEIIPEIVVGKKPRHKFQYEPRINILPMGSDDYIGTMNGQLIKGDMARIIRDFRHESFKREITLDKTIINDILYKDDPLANILLGISIGSTISNVDELLDHVNTNNKSNGNLEKKIKELVHETNEVSKNITDQSQED
jgi:NADH:ubiquinone reductase (H+-translocating)